MTETELYGPDYRLVGYLLGQLPRCGWWTSERRARWLAALRADLDLLVEVVPEDTGQSTVVLSPATLVVRGVTR